MSEATCRTTNASAAPDAPDRNVGATDGTSPVRSEAGTPSGDGASSQPKATIANTNRWDTRQLVTMALMCAIGVLLSFIEFPLMPAAPFLKYDASIVPALVCGFAFGPAAGFAVGAVGAIIHGLLYADLAGCLMNILVVVGFVLPASLVYARKHTLKGAVAGLACSIVAATAMAILGNLVITPLWLGAPLEAVIVMIVPILVPFNLIKAVLNSVLTLVVYKSISNLITPKKKQVKGR